MNAPIVRALRKADRPEWEKLWAGYLEFYESHLAPEVTDTTFERLIAPTEPMFGLVAEDERGVLLGFVHCVLHRGTWSVEDHCYLEDLFVASEARGHGVGRALIEAVYARADELKLSRVYWMTHETNATARKLYDQIAERSGFIQYRRARL